MLKSMIMILALLGGTVGMVHADESAGEKAEATAHKARRETKKMMHRAQEKVCAEGDAKCLSEKVKHRSQEGSDYLQDKSQEAKDKAQDQQ